MLTNPCSELLPLNLQDQVVIVAESCSSSAHSIRARRVYGHMISIVSPEQPKFVLTVNANKLTRQACEAEKILDDPKERRATWLSTGITSGEYRREDWVEVKGFITRCIKDQLCSDRQLCN